MSQLSSSNMRHWDVTGAMFNLTADSCVYHDRHCHVGYSRGHGLHTLTAVPRSTQPSILLAGKAKQVLALSLTNNNKW